MSVQSSHQWSELLSLLTQGRTDQDTNRKCSVRLLDTIYIPHDGDVNAPEWYFTTKSGSVARKKGDKARLSGVYERFSKFALANPNNSERTVGVFVHGNGYRQFLSENSLREMLEVNSSVLLQEGSHLQVYLRPHAGISQTAKCHVTSTAAGKPTVECIYVSASGDRGASPAAAVQEQAHAFAREIVDHLMDCRGLKCISAEIDFIVDDNQHVWLSHIPAARLAPREMSSGVNENKEGADNMLPSLPTVEGASDALKHDDDLFLQALGSRPGSSSSRPGSRPGSSRGGIDGMQPVSGATGAIGWGQYFSGGTLLSQDGGQAFCCRMGPDDLPGLRAWSLMSLGGDNLQWSVDLNEYDPNCILSPNPTVEAVRHQRTEQRHKESALLVMVMRVGDRIMLGKDADVTNQSSFKSAWQDVYEKAQKEYKQAKSSGGSALDEKVVVCGNTHAICRKLESLCRINFRPMDIPQAEEVAVEEPGHSQGVRKINVYQDDSRPSSELSNVRHGTSSNSDRPNSSGDIGQTLGDKSPVLENPFFPGSEIEKEAEKKMPVKAGKKGKTTMKATQSGFRRDGKGFDAAPNVEMIARFAAEKERQQREMRDKKQDAARRQAALMAVASDDPLYDESQDGGMSQEWPERQLKKKGKKPKKKRNPSSLAGEFHTDEQRLNYLEGLVSRPRQSFDQFPGPAMYNPGGSQVSMLSGSEADFMVRQAQSGDPNVGVGVDVTAGDSLGSLAGAPAGMFPGGALDQGSVASNISLGAGLNHQVENALKERVIQLEAEVAQLRTSAEKRNFEYDSLEGKLRRANTELANSRRSLALERTRLQEEHEKAIISLRESHALQMASATAEAKAHIRVTDPTQPSTSSQLEGNQQLLEQLETLRTEHRRQQMKFADERQMFQAEASGKLMSVERQFKTELHELKRNLAASEDERHHIDEDARAAHAKVASLEQLCHTLEEAKRDAVNSQNKLRADLKNMQQSVNASYRLESAQGLTVGVDADTQIRLNEAKSEASKRQLVNKVDFLKAQLAAEQASGEELRSTVEGNRAKMEEMREEFRLRAQEIERSKQGAIEDAERRIEAQYEGRMNELTTLQSKMQMMQGQLQEAFNDSSLIKQREESAKTAAAKAQSAQSILRAEIDQLRQQVVEIRAEKDQLEIASGSKQNNDAVIRRLDNERQYLKSQLASEITHKNELQAALAKNQHQLNEVQKQWKSDVDSLKESHIIDDQEARSRESELKSKAIALEGDNNRLEAANKDLKEAFVKMRDQVRMEQLSIENAVSVNRRLQEQFDLTKAELKRAKENEEAVNQEHSDQLQALKNTIQEIEERRASELAKAKDDLSQQFLQNSEAQKDFLSAKRDIQVVRETSQRKNGAQTLVDKVSRWRLNRLSAALRIWSTSSTLIGVAAQFRGHVNKLVDDTIADQQKEKQKSLSELRQELDGVLQQKLSEQSEELNARQELALIESEERHRVALQESDVEHQQHLRDQEQRWTEILDNARQESEAELFRLQETMEVGKKEFSDRCQADLDSALEDSRRRIDDANTQKEMADQMITRLKTQLQEFEDMHNKALVELMAEHTVKERANEKAVALEAAAALERANEDKKNALAVQEKEFFEEMDKLRSRMNSNHNESEEKLKEFYEDQQQQALDAAEIVAKQRLADLRKELEEQHATDIAKHDVANEEKLREKMDSYAKSVEAERQRAVKLESSKWRQALKDAEHRFDLETSKAKAEGRAEAKKETRLWEETSARNHELEMARIADETSEKIKALQNEHEAEIARELQNQERLKIEEMKAHETLTIQACEKKHSDDLATKIEETWKDANELWGKKLAKQEERLETFKGEVSQQMQQMAAERNDLVNKVNQNEDIIKRMDQLNKAEIAQLQKDHDAERNLNSLKFEKAKKLAIQDLANEQQSTLDGVEAKYKEIADRRVQLERSRLEEDMNKQISQLQIESDGLISGLEAAVNELREEKELLTTKLTNTSAKLEDTEDTLYDLQQSSKKAGKESAITLWRQVISQQRMKERYDGHIDDMEKDFEERERLLERDLMNDQNEMILAALKLAELLTEIEVTRKQTHRVLTNYRTDELLDKRTKIRVLEKDFERLSMEKDALEEQRDLMEEEIEDLEGQVRDMEDQIREHNRTSSMQNGRINVAHARKKRRLDSELERLLETIEQKRIGMGEMDEKGADKARERDTKEQEMVELEKQVVGILVEQQRKVLEFIVQMKGAAEDKCRLVLSVARLPWPPPEAPTIEMVQEMQNSRHAAKQAKKAEAEEI